MGGRSSARCNVNRGVRQGDPMSPFLFNLCVDEMLAAIPDEVGFPINGHPATCLAFADDLVVITSSVIGMKKTLQRITEAASGLGLSFNPQKCHALSLIPDGHNKKLKVCTERLFKIHGQFMPQTDAVSTWRYLGIEFGTVGAKTVELDAAVVLRSISKAPLKPQQRLAILRSYFLPRLMHGLVLGRITDGRLLQLDRQVRKAVRGWLRLPKDVSLGYFHAKCKSGGLGIPCLRTTVPMVLHNRISAMQNSAGPLAKAAWTHTRVQKRLSWASHALRKQGVPVDGGSGYSSHWSKKLHASTDGVDLREAEHVRASTQWISSGTTGVPGRDFVQYIHVQSGSLPTRVRTSRGARRDTMPTLCRAGCQVKETAAHVVQQCHRTHGGRIMRHNAVYKLIGGALTTKGWKVIYEPQLQSSSGLRKPDIVASKDGAGIVLDAQVVSGRPSMDAVHESKKMYYADNESLMVSVVTRLGVPREHLAVSAVTISWKGV